MRRVAMLSVALIAGIPTVPPTAPPTSGPVEDIGQTDGGGSIPAQPAPPVTLPVVPVPAGCTAPPLPHVVFVGRARERDYRTVQFQIEQVRAGNPAPFANGDVINIRYGLDAQYLDIRERYLVSAPVDPDLGLLVSRVTEPIVNFGGDEVIGVSESDVNCPRFDDPMRTLHTDGTPIDADMVEPFLSAKARIMGAILLPLGVAFGLIFLLAAVRLSLSGMYHGIRGASVRRS